MSRPLAIDLFCKAGGATKGLQRAGYYVVGVDIRPQPRYCGDEFVQADALTYPLNGADLVWASPKCQGYTKMNAPGADRAKHERQIPAVRARLKAQSAPWVIENVSGARSELHSPICLCGSSFGLGAWHLGKLYQLQRHRLFESNFPIEQPECRHCGAVVGIYGGHARCRAAAHGGRGTRDAWNHHAVASEAMGIDWMTLGELSEAIPPAYAEHIGQAAPVRAGWTPPVGHWLREGE